MPNENCLEGIKCPDCGQDQEFRIQANAVFVVTDSGTDSCSDVSWDEQSHILCSECERSGTVGEFSGAPKAKARVIALHLEGGIVQEVSGLPAGYELHVEDHDEGDTNHPAWDEAKRCFVTVFEEKRHE
jgi:hypothetical protein